MNILIFLNDYDLIQKILNILTIISFCVSIYLFVSKKISERRNIKISILDHAERATQVVQFFIYIQNCSNSPITISSICIVNSNKLYPCELLPKKIKGSGSDILKTPMFPINFSPKQGHQCFLEFLYCEDVQLIAGKTVDLQIHTNRGVINKSLILPHISHYLHNKM